MEPRAPATAKEPAVPFNQACEVGPRIGVQWANREVACADASRVHFGLAIVGLVVWLRYLGTQTGWRLCGLPLALRLSEGLGIAGPCSKVDLIDALPWTSSLARPRHSLRTTEPTPSSLCLL